MSFRQAKLYKKYKKGMVKNKVIAASVTRMYIASR